MDHNLVGLESHRRRTKSMKTTETKRKEALWRLERRQEQAEAKLAELKKDRKNMEKTAPKNGDVLIKHGLLAGFSVKDQKEAVDRHIEQMEGIVARRAKEIQHLRSLR